MTTVAAPELLVTGGVDTHLDLHVAATLNHLGGVLGTASFPTTVPGYRRLLAWLRGFGTLGRVGVEGTGSYGAALARYLTAESALGSTSSPCSPRVQVTRLTQAPAAA